MILASARSLRARFAEAPELIGRELLGKLAVWAVQRELALHECRVRREREEFSDVESLNDSSAGKV